MTTGNKTVDSRVQASQTWADCSDVPSTSYGLIGKYWQKSWSGVDSPKQSASSRKPETFVYSVYNRDGSVKGKRKFVYHTPREKMLPKKQKNWNNYSASFTLRADMAGTRTSFCDSDGSHPAKRYLSRSVWSDTRPNYIYSNILPGFFNSEDESALYGKLSARLGSGFNLPAFLGEGRESLRTIADSATRIYKAIKAVKKGNLPKAWNVLRGAPRGSPLPSYVVVNPGRNRKNIADNWLQLQYGWKPLLNDIFSACKHIAYTQNRDFSRTYRVRTSKNWEGDFRIATSPQIQSAGGMVSVKKQLSAKITSIDQLALLGVKDPRAVIWELVPFSFIADWFIPVGNYLEQINLRSALSGTFLISYLNVATTTNYKLVRKVPTDSDEYQYYNATAIQAGRIVLSSLPKPQLPQVKPLSEIVTWQHAVNAVALVVSRVF